MKNFIKHIGLSEFIAIDLETTGLNPKEDKIIEISACKFKKGIFVDSFTYLINPEKKIGNTATQITGITNAMVEDKPLFKDIEVAFLSFIEDFPIVGHNIIFDMNFLKSYVSNYNSIFSNRMICDTYYLSKIYCYNYNSFSLVSLCQNFNIEILDSHRAEEDAKNSGLLFFQLLEKIKNSNLDLLQSLKQCIGNFNVPNNKLFDKTIDYFIKKNPSINNETNICEHLVPSVIYENDSDCSILLMIFLKKMD